MKLWNNSKLEAAIYIPMMQVISYAQENKICQYCPNNVVNKKSPCLTGCDLILLNHVNVN